jgi:hypothetical protein
MKSTSKILIFSVAIGLFVKCSNNSEPSTTSSISLKMSAATSSGNTLISGRIAGSGSRLAIDTTKGITLTDVIVNVRDIKFDLDEKDEHSKKDTVSYSEDDDIKLKGPFLVDIMNAGSFVDQVVTSVNLPNKVFERVRFKLVPSSASGDMSGKSILITGKIDTIPFVFWHKRDANFGAKFYNSLADSTSNDSTSISTNGATITLAIHLELDKIFNALNGGIDLHEAVDGNKDGVISINSNNDDGNKWIADKIMMLLVRHARCEKKDK